LVPPSSTADLVVAIDVGTTATKVTAFAVDGRPVAAAEHGYPLHAPAPGRAEQDPDELLAAVQISLADVVAQVGADRVAGLALSSAMHTLMGLDGEGRPLTALTSWADTRAEPQADRLRADPSGLALHRRTGTPVHPMSPLPRLVWFAENEPDLCARVVRWAGIKEYLLLQLCDAWVMDHSIASATGLMNLETLAWDTEALQIARVTPAQLPALVPTTHVVRLTGQVASAVGLRAGTPVVVGAGDGPLANLGVGAVRPGMAACSLGTSGALRVVVDRPAVDPQGRVFCYALAPGLWVVGGAINNGGIVMRWALESLAPDLGPGAEKELLRLAAQVPPGSDGLLMLPSLLSERAPRWTSFTRGSYVGLTREHGRGHLFRAALEGVGLQLALVLESMRGAGLEVDEVRATGGVMRSELWQQLLADVLDMPIELLSGHQGSGYGAAILGMASLGLIDSIDDAAAATRVVQTVRPEPGAVAVYAALRPIFNGLDDALAPSFAALRGLYRTRR
jgi:gluconokinase